MTLSITADDLVLDYGDTRALDHLNLHLEGGRIYGLLGRNGSGKTSFASLAAAFRRPTSGEITVGGTAPFEAAEIVSQICLIREGGDVFESDRVSSVLRFAAAHRPYWSEERAGQLVERFRIPTRKRVTQLSRGMRSALGVTLGLASRAPVTLFDEVHLGMDAPSRYAFYEELLNDYLAHPRTVILSTHLIEEVSSLFEEVVILDRGGLVLHESADDMRERGAAVTGPSRDVEDFTSGMRVLGRQTLGATSQVTVFGGLDAEQRRQATSAGLEIGPVPLQDLFIHLTDPERETP
ncbi:ABC-2 type transport system ATP-binding protein [Stackebrandtia albiflava]|uniref:ABC-2 type transport system ATP-binding protein n=1 Tax=Stackebrandtia albiflava TaxID=406432 RepID=A0A562VEE6_9ACTN|nr:ABC transporter ATP-binding protein [Stackebrandtia albiflava]TWJ16252.1 ABC-2 type transport system ATP-binding protein [Stackebrandtia albiflava]